jgi:hypothetical protein
LDVIRLSGVHGERIKEAAVLVVAQLEFLRVLCGFSFANFAVKGCCSWSEKQQILTAKGAKKGRQGREEIQTEPLPWSSLLFLVHWMFS